MSATNRFEFGATRAAEAIGNPRCRIKNPATCPVRCTSGHEHVEIHPNDALDLELHVIGQHIRSRARQRHDKLRSSGRPKRPTTVIERTMTRTQRALLTHDRSLEPSRSRAT